MGFVTVLSSGGIESIVATTQASQQGKSPRAIHFDIGQDSERKELAAINKLSILLGNPVQLISFPGLQQMFSGIMDEEVLADEGDVGCKVEVSFLPGLIELALLYSRQAGADGLFVGLTRDQLGSNKAAALKELFDANNAYNPDFPTTDLVLPFSELTKDQVITLGSSLGVALADTWSCFKGGPSHCGSCGACVSRKAAFSRAGIEDPTTYLS